MSSYNCNNCRKVGANLTCSRCKTAHYCSVECQKSNWNNHKIICKNTILTKELHKSLVDNSDFQNVLLTISDHYKDNKTLYIIVNHYSNVNERKISLNLVSNQTMRSKLDIKGDSLIPVYMTHYHEAVNKGSTVYLVKNTQNKYKNNLMECEINNFFHKYSIHTNTSFNITIKPNNSIEYMVATF